MVAFVAEPKKPKGKPGPKPDPSRARSALITIRCKPQYRDWVNRFAERLGLDVAELVDDSLLKRAREEGFEMPPPR